MKTSIPSRLSHLQKLGALSLAVLAATPAIVTHAADIRWIGGTASYTNAALWDSNSVPIASDNAISANGIGNVVQINVGNPDWSINDLSAGGAANGGGAIVQNGQIVTVNSWLHVGDGLNSVGLYTLNNGILNVPNGRLFLGEQPGSTSTFVMNGGVLNKSGDFIVIGDGGWNGNGARTAVFTQTGGTINSSSEFQIANIPLADGTYNLSGGTNNTANWFSVGRFGGAGKLNVSGGAIFKTGGGNFYVAEGVGTGEFNFTGGLIDINSELWVGNGGTSVGVMNMSGASSITVGNWIAIGRNGGAGTLNLTNGTITRIGGGNFAVGAGGGAGVGIINQYGGTINNTANPSSLTYLAENGGNGTWNMFGGAANVGVLQFCQGGSGSGALNLNGGVVSAFEVNCGFDGANGFLSFNGGTLRATGDNANFFHGLGGASIQAGGAVLDSQGFNVTVSQSLTDGGGGGLTKIGSGTVTLTGFNSYVGATLVNAGTLAITTDPAGAGDYSVASGALLNVKVQSANAQLNTANFSFATGTPALGLDLGAFGNPTAAPVNVTGNLAVNGTVSLNIADALPQIGQFPLIKYGTKSGAGSFVVGSLPVGVVASISNNIANSSIDLVIATVNLPRWDGQAGGNWDIGLTTNWVNIGDNLPTFYGQGNAVEFNDSALGTTTVNLTTTVNPSKVLINNSTLTYTLNGAGKISGNITVTKQGTGLATITNTGGNNYTGPTVLSGGTLSVNSLANGGAPSSIGASSANPTNLVLSGGALSYAGAPVTINRGYSVLAGGGTIDAQSNLTLSGLATAAAGTAFTKTGPARLAYTTVGSNILSGSSSTGYFVKDGTVLFDGAAGGQTNTVQGQLRVGDVSSLTSGISITNARVIVTGSMELGNSSSATSTLTLNSNALLTVQGNPLAIGRGPSTGVVVQNAGTMDCRNEMWIGQALGGFGNYILTSGSLLQSNWFAIGRANGNGTLTMTGGTITKGGGGNFVIGTGAGNNSLNSAGVLNQSGGTITCLSEYWLAENLGSTGTNNISGVAVLNLNNWMSIGRGGTGTVNFASGTINKTGNGQFIVADGGVALFNQTGGALTIASELWIGQGGNGIGQYNMVAGSMTNNSWLAVGREGADGVLNISGGSMTKQGGGNISITHGGNATGIVNQTGGSFACLSGETWIGEDNGPATWNISGGTANFGLVLLARFGTATGTLNLNGGIFSANEITTSSAGASTANLNGGTLGALANNVDFLHGLTAANVLSNGVTINSGTNTVSISQALLDGTGGGGLIKTGTGTLRLNGVNTYTGATTVNAGTLGGIGTIAGPVSVASGATLAPGASIGTLTINNTLTLAAGSSSFVEISLNGGTTNCDLVTGLTGVSYAGPLVATNVGTNVLVAGTVFKLFNAAAPGTGNFTSVTILPAGTGTFNPATGELTITSSGILTINPPAKVGGNLILAGTGGTPGGSYAWLTATNVATPVVNWTTNSTGVFSGSGTFSNAIPINPAEAARFFRLKTP